MNLTVPVPFLSLYPWDIQPSSKHMAFIHTLRRSGLSMSLWYFVIVLFIFGCNTPFATSSMLNTGFMSGGWPISFLGAKCVASSRRALLRYDYKAVCEIQAGPLEFCTCILFLLNILFCFGILLSIFPS